MSAYTDKTRAVKRADLRLEYASKVVAIMFTRWNRAENLLAKGDECLENAETTKLDLLKATLDEALAELDLLEAREAAK